MAPVSFGAVPPPVGLDIGTDHVRAALIKPSGSGFTLAAYGAVTVPFGAVVEGEIVDPHAVGAAIKELWKTAGIRSKEVAIGVSNQKVVVRLIDLPFMEKDELAGAIQYQAQDYIPIPVEEAILSYERIGDYMTPADEHMMEVLLVAAQRDMISSAVAAVEAAGLRLAQIDVTAFALVRSLLGPVASVLPDELDEQGSATALIHITSGLTNIAVVERSVPRFTRASALGGNQFTQAIANVLNLTFDEAETLKIRVGLPSLDGTAMAPAGVDPETARVAQEALEREANKFIAEVRRSLDYYLTQATQVRTIKRIVLAGQRRSAREPLDLPREGAPDAGGHGGPALSRAGDRRGRADRAGRSHGVRLGDRAGDGWCGVDGPHQPAPCRDRRAPEVRALLPLRLRGRGGAARYRPADLGRAAVHGRAAQRPAPADRRSRHRSERAGALARDLRRAAPGARRSSGHCHRGALAAHRHGQDPRGDRARAARSAVGRRTSL